MQNTINNLLTWEELKQEITSRYFTKIKTGNPIVDDVLSRIVHWSNGPTWFQDLIKDFIHCAAENCWKERQFTIHELNLLKWYVGQWIAGMFEQPIRWDEKLDKIKTGEELAEFILTLLDYAIDPL